METPKFTREQIMSLSFDRHLAVTANAGSGKTTVLEQRYLNILLNSEGIDNKQIEPKDIVAITFTRKAAKEIATRVAQAIEQKISTEKQQSKLRRLVKIREHLLYSPISTIHSFCSTILRSYPVQAKISPNFIELSGSDVLELKQNAIFETWEEWLNGTFPDKKIKALGLFSNFGKNNLQKYLKMLLSKRELFPFLKDIY
ncbi:MAG: UvrD-helicase domain-containing protein, partial [Bacteroidota bacterium]